MEKAWNDQNRRNEFFEPLYAQAYYDHDDMSYNVRGYSMQLETARMRRRNDTSDPMGQAADMGTGAQTVQEEQEIKRRRLLGNSYKHMAKWDS